MTFEEFKEYIGSVKDNPKFIEIYNFTQMGNLKSSKDFYESLNYYLSLSCAKNSGNGFEPDYEYFVKFVRLYLSGESQELIFNEEGFIELSKNLHIVKPLRFCGGGRFTDNNFMTTNGKKYISKYPTNYFASYVRNKNCLYAPVIASYVAKVFDVEAADISLGISRRDGSRRIISKNFLKPSEQLVTYGQCLKVSEQLALLEETLRLRRFDKSEIEKVKLDFIKQEFVTKLIGLRDQSEQNCPLALLVDEQGKRHIRIAPLFDLDFSFHIAEEANLLLMRTCDNGKTDVASFIEQYKNYPGFIEWVVEKISCFDTKKFFQNMAKETKIKDFEDFEIDEEMKKYIIFLDNNIQLARNAIDRTFKEERDGLE